MSTPARKNIILREGWCAFENKAIVPDLLLLLTAAIWGFAFVAQRAGMDHMGPFLFNGIRFALGAAVLLPVIAFRGRRGSRPFSGFPVRDGALAGLVLFAGASLQQTGLVYTTAGNAGFITGLYVLLVPVLGIFLGQPTGWRTWAGSVLAVGGTFLLSSAGSSRMATGDLIVLAGALFWAAHIQLISRLMQRHRALHLAAVQFGFCSILSFAFAAVFGRISTAGLAGAAIPLLYGGLISVGIAFTLQVVAQKRAHPSHAAVIMSLETVFALAGGWLMLGEDVTTRGAFGGLLILTAMILSATGRYRRMIPAGL